jgi:soluble lytic murein transglycosylase-like protein
MSKKNPKLFIFFLLGLFFCRVSIADIYKYTAPDGTVHFTDKRVHKHYKRVIKSKFRKKSKSKSRVAYRAQKKNKEKYSPLILAIASDNKIDPNLLHAIIRAESAYDPNAVSRVGAVGLMQLMPATAKRYGVTNRRNPKQNIKGGTRYLKDLLKMFDSNLKLVIAAYNAGENAVKKYRNSIPPYPETQKYVKTVMAYYQKAG